MERLLLSSCLLSHLPFSLDAIVIVVSLFFLPLSHADTMLFFFPLFLLGKSTPLCGKLQLMNEWMQARKISISFMKKS